MALPYSHTDEYLVYHHRTFIWGSKEIETETHIGAPECTSMVENMSKEVRTARGRGAPLYTLKPCHNTVCHRTRQDRIVTDAY